MQKPSNKDIFRFSDFQLFLLLHIRIAVLFGENRIRIRPNKIDFPMKISEVFQEISIVLNDVGFFPIFSAFLGSSEKIEEFSTEKMNGNIISSGPDYFKCLTQELFSYSKTDWGIILIFEKDDLEAIWIKIENFLWAYRTQFLVENSHKNYQFTRREDRRLKAMIKDHVGYLDLDFKERNSGIFTVFLLHHLGDVFAGPQIDIMDSPHLNSFPYALRFKTYYFHREEKEHKPVVKINIFKDYFEVNGVKIYENRKNSSKHKRNPIDIMRYLLSRRPKINTRDLLYFLEGNILPFPDKTEKKECLKLKNVVGRINKKIEDKTGLKVFEDVGYIEMIFEKNFKLRTNIAKSTKSVT